MHAVQPAEVHSILKNSILTDGYPFVFDLEKSHGSWLVDARNGEEWLDFGSGYASTALSHNHPAFFEPDFERRLLTAARHKPANSDRYTTYYAEFIETVATLAVPDSHPHLFFIEGGAPAIENALKVAMDWKVRKNIAAGHGERGRQIIHFKNAFHGRLGFTMSLTNTHDPRKYQYFARFDWPRFDIPAVTYPETPASTAVVAAEEQRILGEIDEYLGHHSYDVAAIIIEPIQGEGGDNHVRANFLQGLRDLADRYDVMLIFDEIQTGMGMTGTWWAFQQLGVEPDIFAFAKKMQTGGIAANRRVDEVQRNAFVESSRINSTWGGDLTDMVRATQVMQTIVNDDLLINAREIGERLLAGLREMQSAGTISNVRGRGLMSAFDLPDEETRDRVRQAAVNERLIVLGCGEKSIRLRPFLDVDTATAEEFLDRTERAIAKAS